MIEVQVESVEPRQLQVTIAVSPERIDKAMYEVAQDFARRLRISGYRPGKVPLKVVANRVDEKELREAALERLKEQAVREALKKESIEPWAGVEVEVTKDAPYTLKALVPLAPEVELADTSVLTAVPEPVEPIPESEVDSVLERWRQERAVVETADRPADEGDIVVVTLAGSAEGIDPIAYSGLQVQLTSEGAAKAGMPTGIADELLGAAAGDHRSFVLTYSEYWPVAHLQGREVSFEADVEAVLGQTLPDLDDAFAKEAAGIDSLEDLRSGVRERLESAAAEEVRSKHVEALIDALVAASRVEYPPVALAQETAATIVDLRMQLERQGLSWERWLELQKRTEEELWADIEPEAANQLRRRLVLRRFVEAEGIRVSSREIDAEVNRLRQPLDRSSRRNLPVQALRRRAGSRILSSRAVERLVEIAAANAAAPPEEPGEA